MKELRTTKTVVLHLGDGDPAKGFERLCVLTRANKKQAYNWTGRSGKFPAATYKVMIDELARLGATAPAKLWNQRGT
jgi:hypothetical protein